MIDDIKKAEHSLSIFSIRQFFPSSGYGLGAFLYILGEREFSVSSTVELVLCHLLSDSECKSQIYLRQK